MIWAVKKGAPERIKASPNEKKAVCPLCLEPVIPKCGKIKIWHWSHQSLRYCDIWGEAESKWHIDWKNEFPKECQEVIMGEHRADIYVKGQTIELQNSSISSEEIQKREAFYKNMIWVLNGEKFAKNLILKKKDNYFTFRWKYPPKSWWVSQKPIYVDLSYKIKEMKRKILEYENGKKHTVGVYETYYSPAHDMEFKKVSDYIDDTESHLARLKKWLWLFEKRSIFLVKKVYGNTPCGGWGILIPKHQFIKEVNNG